MKKKVIISIFIILLLCGIGTGIYFGFIKKDNNNDNKIKENPINENESPENKEELKVKDNLKFEINDKLASINDFFEQELEEQYTIKYFLNNDEIIFEESYNKLGEYNVIIEYDKKEYNTNLIVVDTKSPELKLKEVTQYTTDKLDINKFVDSCTDNSHEKCILEFKEEYKFNKEGNYNIVIKAKDSSGNEIEKTTKLTLKEKTVVKFVEKKKETNTITKDFKYGIKVTETTTTTYDLYSDGSIKNKKTTTSSKYDYSGYKATTKELLSEATANRKTYSSQVNEVLKNTNAYRKEKGASDLKLDETLTKAAMVRALEMSYGNNLSHTRPNGDSCFSIFADFGYTYSIAAENIAWGQSSATAATTWWRNSEGHYKNMVTPEFTKIGIGVMKLNGKYYWVQLFA